MLKKKKKGWYYNDESWKGTECEFLLLKNKTSNYDRSQATNKSNNEAHVIICTTCIQIYKQMFLKDIKIILRSMLFRNAH